MAKYRHKTTGEVITVVHFDGSMNALREIKESFFPKAKFMVWDQMDQRIYVDQRAFAICVGNDVTQVPELYDGHGPSLGIMNMDLLERDYTIDYEASVKMVLPEALDGMSTNDQIAAFTGDLWKVVERYMDEFELPLAGAIKVLELIKDELIRGAHEKDS